MESLALPKELLWNGKVEPTSPKPSELFPITNYIGEWLIDDDYMTTEILLSADNNALELKTGSDITSKICNDDNLIIEFYDIKEEQWTDTKSNSTPYLDYNSLGTVIEQPSLITKVQNPFELSDNNNAAGYDATILTQLTPPQSPPQVISSSNPVSLHDAPNVKEILDFIVQQTTDSSVSSSHLPLATTNSSSSSNDVTSSQSLLDYTAWNNGNDITVNPTNFVPFQSEIERETQIVDEIVKSRAKELLDWNDDDCVSESSSSLSPPSTDEDWTPTSPSNLSSSNESPEYGASGTNNQSDQIGKSLSAQHLSKKRTRPYGRCPEDRKSRKKEQNKNAATRYRQKKKQEMECVLGEEQLLAQRNDELKKTLADRKREAKYLKTLIKEFYLKTKSK